MRKQGLRAVLRLGNSRVLPDRPALSHNNEARIGHRRAPSRVHIGRRRVRNRVRINNHGMPSRARIGRFRTHSRVHNQARIGSRRMLGREHSGLHSRFMVGRDNLVSRVVRVSLCSLAVRASRGVPLRRHLRRVARGASCFGLHLWS